MNIIYLHVPIFNPLPQVWNNYENTENCIMQHGFESSSVLDPDAHARIQCSQCVNILRDPQAPIVMFMTYERGSSDRRALDGHATPRLAHPLPDTLFLAILVSDRTRTQHVK